VSAQEVSQAYGEHRTGDGADLKPTAATTKGSVTTFMCLLVRSTYVHMCGSQSSARKIGRRSRCRPNFRELLLSRLTPGFIALRASAYAALFPCRAGRNAAVTRAPITTAATATQQPALRPLTKASVADDMSTCDTSGGA